MFSHGRSELQLRFELMRMNRRIGPARTGVQRSADRFREIIDLQPCAGRDRRVMAFQLTVGGLVYAARVASALRDARADRARIRRAEESVSDTIAALRAAIEDFEPGPARHAYEKLVETIVRATTTTFGVPQWVV